MSYLLHTNFNENDNTNVYDYSTNGNHAVDISNLTIAASDVGYKAQFDETAYINFGDVGDVTTDMLSIFLKVKLNQNANQTILFKDDHYKLELKHEETPGLYIKFSVKINGNWESVNSGVLETARWYKLHFIYGIYLYDYYNADYLEVFINGSSSAKTELITDHPIDSSNYDLVIGAEASGTYYSNFFDGEIEQLEIWDSAHDSDTVLAKYNSPIGLKYETYKANEFELADLIAGKIQSNIRKMVITFWETNKIFYAIPINKNLNFDDIIIKRGNIYDTDRQCVSDFRINTVTGKPSFLIKDGITNFTDAQLDENNFLEVGDFKILTTGKISLGFTAGSVVFSDGINLTEDNDNFFWDNNNNRLGIGLNTPAYSLDLNGNFNLTNKIYIRTTQLVYLPDQTDFTGAIIVGNGGQSLSHSSSIQGFYNTFFGIGAGFSTTIGNANTFIGFRAGEINTEGSQNIFIGTETGKRNTEGNNNVFVGVDAGINNINGSSNVFIGAAAGWLNEDGQENIYIGLNAGQQNVSGQKNTMLGYQAGACNIGSSNIFLGYFAGLNETGSNKLYISNSDTATPLIYGEFDNNLLIFNGNVGIGATPLAKLNISGGMLSEGDQRGLYLIGTYTESGINHHPVKVSTIHILSAGNGVAGFSCGLATGGTANNDHIAGFQSAPRHNSSGTLVDLVGYNSVLTNYGGTVTNAKGLWIFDPSGTGDITNNYGFFCAALTKGTTKNFAVYTEGATKSYFGGQVGFGIENPGYAIDVKGLTTGGAGYIVNFQDSAGTDKFRVSDDGLIYIHNSLTNVGMGGLVLDGTDAQRTIAIGYQAGYQFDKNVDTGWGTLVGFEAGKLSYDARHMVALGYQAGSNTLNNNARSTVAIGYQALRSPTGSVYLAVGIGYQALAQTRGVSSGSFALGGTAGRFSNGINNIFVAREAGYNSEGNNNLCFGYQSFYNGGSDGVDSDNNILIGTQTGYNLEGDNNIYIGYRQGYNAGDGLTESNRLRIDYEDTATPLIYGEFDNDLLRINGSLEIGDQAGGHYTEIKIDGEINLHGTARVIQTIELNVGAISLHGLNVPTLTDLGIGKVLRFSDAGVNYEVVTTRIKVPKDMDTSVQPKIVICWSSATTDPGDDSKQCRWEINYLWRTENESFAAAAEGTVTDNYSSSTTANGCTMNEVQLSNLASNDVCLIIQIARRSDDADDTLGDNADLQAIHLQYTKNKLGEAI